MAGGGGPSMDPAVIAALERADGINRKYDTLLLVVLAAAVVVVLIWRVTDQSIKHLRLLACMNDARQNYFRRAHRRYARVKQHLLYAPLFQRRHSEEFQASSAVKIGSLPTRPQIVVLLAYFAVNVAFLLLEIQFGQPVMIAAKTLRNRAGSLAVTNMIPLFILAGRNNPLISLLHISFDTFNLLHRWVGRTVVLLALVHFFAHLYAYTKTHGAAAGWAMVQIDIKGGEFITYGFTALVALFSILVTANSLLRHAFYETFKLLHIALVTLVLVMLYYHLHLVKLPQVSVIYGVIAIWVVERVIRFVRLAYRSMGPGGTTAIVEALPGNACRVTVDMARPWEFQPGQHAYLYVPGISWWQSHPFSVAWSEAGDRSEGEKLALDETQDVLGAQKAKMCFVVRARTGFTDKLFRAADAAPGKLVSTRCFLEGPYGGQHRLDSYGTVLLFAGGVGITHQVAYIRQLVAGHAAGTVAARRIALVWVIQHASHLEWIRPWMTSILQMEGRRDCLRIMLFVSRPLNNKEVHSPSATVQMFPGRPNVAAILDAEIEEQVGAMGVSVCGSGGFSDDVRLAVRSRQRHSNVDFVEEAFTW